MGQIKLNSGASVKTTQQHKMDMRKMEMGWVGIAFGSAENISKNVTALIIFGITILIALLFFTKPLEEAIELSKLIIPVLTLLVGYMFGKNDSGTK